MSRKPVTEMLESLLISLDLEGIEFIDIDETGRLEDAGGFDGVFDFEIAKSLITLGK